MAEIYIPAFTVAEWGGLHENVISAAAALKKAGHRVTMALRDGLIAQRAQDVAHAVHAVDWDDWRIYGQNLLASDYMPDLIFAQPQRSRELALFLAERWGIPVHLMFHGYYADQVSSYEPYITSMAGVSPRIVELLTGYSNVPPWKVSCIPNGIDDAFFRRPKTWPLAAGEAKIVMASRLEADKTRQIDVLRSTIGALRRARPDLRVSLRVLGDGGARQLFVDQLAQETDANIEFTGWLAPENVAEEMTDAFLTVGSGRAAALSLALGTPCIAVGKHATCGLQYNNNLRVGLWSNFGDYPVGKRLTLDSLIETDVPACLEREFYESVSEHARTVLYHERRQSLIDDLLVAFLTQRVDVPEGIDR